MSGEKAPTIYDVARLANVSHQTVSRVVKGSATVNPEMQARVRSAIEMLGYRPNLVARSLATRRPHRIGAVVYGLSAQGPNAIIEAAAARAHEAGYLMDILTITQNDPSGARRVLDSVSQAELAGVVAIPSTTEIARAISAHSGPVPLVIARTEDTSGIDPDFAGVDESIAHLASIGHRRFVHVTGASGWIAAETRTRHYMASIARRGLRSVAVVQGDWSARSGYEAALSMAFDQRPTAVVAANDQIALGVIAGLEHRGIQVPGDVSVVGFDDVDEARYFRPSLTTVHSDFAGYGRTAVEKLLRVLDPEAPWVPAEQALGVVVVRDSTAPPRV